ncbi:MAG: DUF3604 domain-containing protein [Pseudomonadota bacterium]
MIMHPRFACLSLLVLTVSCGEISDPSLNAVSDLVDKAETPSQTVSTSITEPLADRFASAARNPRRASDRASASLTGTPSQEHREVYFGDLHIHTSFSADAYIMGVRSTPDDAYRFARGKTIRHDLGFPVRLRRSLDFAAVTDHAEYLGQAAHADLDLPSTRGSLSALVKSGEKFAITKAWLETSLFTALGGQNFSTPDEALNLAAWQAIIDAAERHNRPGVFTTFVGYEWSAWGANNREHLHRNVLFRGSEVSALPFSALDSENPEDLWRFLERETKAGRPAIAISHNANLSAGRMFAPTEYAGGALSAEYASLRNRIEPLSEIFQIKGQSETHPLLSSDDDFADFEIADLSFFSRASSSSVKGSYARDALLAGLASFKDSGFNPFRFGMIGSSDSHNASSPVEEDNYHGKLPMLDGSAGLRTNKATYIPNRFAPARRWGSGGLAAIWAEENTREALFDALQRREVYATSGPRIRLRVCADWRIKLEGSNRKEQLVPDDRCRIPMGAILRARSPVATPKLFVDTRKDPDGANLDRIQIVKGWIDEKGNAREKVFDVAGSDGRRPDPGSSRLPPIKNTVDARKASYDNSVGARALSATWEDPSFSSSQPSFYYVRVLEIATPRWSTYDAVKLGTEPMHPVSIQERAVSSPIWYEPTDP